MNIKPIDKTIKELLGSGKQFSIPRFQREYSWDKKNYQEFLDDILADDLLIKKFENHNKQNLNGQLDETTKTRKSFLKSLFGG